MSLFHVNPESGDAGPCRAKQGKCPFGGADVHFTTAEGARAYYEKLQESKPKFTSSQKTFGPIAYDLHEYNLALAEKSIASANRRLEKAGVPERFTYEVSSYMEETVDRYGSRRAEPRVKLTVNTPSVKFEGYDFIAVVQKAEAGAVVKAASGYNMDDYDPGDLRCESCGRSMDRQKTYVVQDSNGKLLQVGSSCVKNYFGVEPQGLWALTHDPLAKVKDSDELPIHRTARGSGYGAAPTEEIMAYALAVSDGGEKFISSSFARESGLTSTADMTRTAMDSNDNEYRAEMQRKAQKFLANGEAKRLIEKMKETDKSTAFGRNLSVIANGEYTRWEHMNMLVGGLSEIARERREAAKAAHDAEWGTPKAGYAGEVKEKVAGRKWKIYSTGTYRKKAYGYNSPEEDATKVVFRDEENHEVVWFASKVLDDLAKGDEVTVTAGNVKAHREYRGVDQTLVTRLKVQKDA